MSARLSNCAVNDFIPIKHSVHIDYFHRRNFVVAILATAYKNLNNFIYAAESAAA
jgi:hypothetical protein